MNVRFLIATTALLAAGTSGLTAQGVVVDEGTFAIRLAGAPAGTEDFVIRRPGVGREDALFANGVVALNLPEGRQEMRSLLHAAPPNGVAVRYQVSTTGPGAIEVQVARSNRRYLATIRSGRGLRIGSSRRMQTRAFSNAMWPITSISCAISDPAGRSTCSSHVRAPRVSSQQESPHRRRSDWG